MLNIIFHRQIDNGDGDSAMTLCRQILLAPNMDILRYGDVYSLMVEYFTTRGDNKAAIQLVNELVTRTQQKDNLLFYIDKGLYKNSYINQFLMYFKYYTSV